HQALAVGEVEDRSGARLPGLPARRGEEQHRRSADLAEQPSAAEAVERHVELPDEPQPGRSEGMRQACEGVVAEHGWSIAQGSASRPRGQEPGLRTRRAWTLQPVKEAIMS